MACLTGMATNEVMVSAPLLVLVFDRGFVAGTIAEAWRRRWPVHVGLFSIWLLLATLVARTGTRGGTAGFGINVTPRQTRTTPTAKSALSASSEAASSRRNVPHAPGTP